jgi:hypothetical protein
LERINVKYLIYIIVNMEELPFLASGPAAAPAVASPDEMIQLKKKNERLRATFSGFMQENEGLKSELEECHAKLKELHGRPVVRAEVEVESPAVQAVQALEPEPQMEDPKTEGWVKFKGATTKFGGQAGDAPMEWVVSDIDGLPTAIAMRGVPKTGDKYIELTKKYTIHPCPHSGFECRQRGHGHKPNCYYPCPGAAAATPDEFLMAIDGMRAINQSGNRIQGWIPRVPNVGDYDVYVRPGVSLEILAAKILELKGPREYRLPTGANTKHTFHDPNLKIVVENEEDRAYLEQINTDISGLISQTGGYMKSKRRKKKTKRRKKKSKRRKKKTKRRKLKEEN